MPLIRDISAQLANKNMDHFTNHVMNALLLFMAMRLSFLWTGLYG